MKRDSAVLHADGAAEGEWVVDVRRAQQGDREAFDRLVERFREPVMAAARRKLGNRQDAEEVTQEAFVQAWRELRALRDPARFPGWLRRIAQTRGSNFGARWRQDTLPLDGVDWGNWSGGVAPSGSVGNGTGGDTARMREAIESLSEVNRLATRLFYVDGHSIEEIATLLGVPAGTVKRRLHDSRGRLRALLPDAAGGRRRGKAIAPTDQGAGAVAARNTAVTGALDKEGKRDMTIQGTHMQNTLGVPAGLLLGALRRASVAAAKDELRPGLGSVALRWTAETVVFGAADGVRVAEVTLSGMTVRPGWLEEGGPRTMLLTARTASAVEELLSGVGEDDEVLLVLTADRKRVMIAVGEHTRLTPFVGGEFPQVVPLPDTWLPTGTRVSVGTEVLRDVLRGAEPNRRGGAPLLLDATATALNVFQRSGGELTEGYEDSLPAALDGVPGRVALNGTYLLDAVEVAKAGRMEITWGEGLKPLVVREVEKEGADPGVRLSARWAVMPMAAPLVMEHRFGPA